MDFISIVFAILFTIVLGVSALVGIMTVVMKYIINQGAKGKLKVTFKE